MTYTVTPEDILAIRYELNDNQPGLYILDDSTITYYLEKNQGSISASAIDCCKAILFRLSMDSSDSTVDILTLKGSKAAESYRLALQLYLRDPSLNPLMKSANPYAGNISKQDMLDNNSNPDTNFVSSINEMYETRIPSDNPFVI